MDIFEQVKKILCDQLDLDDEQVTEDSEVITIWVLTPLILLTS